jgi:hypothetical protein
MPHWLPQEARVTVRRYDMAHSSTYNSELVLEAAPCHALHSGIRNSGLRNVDGFFEFLDNSLGIFCAKDGRPGHYNIAS